MKIGKVLMESKPEHSWIWNLIAEQCVRNDGKMLETYVCPVLCKNKRK